MRQLRYKLRLHHDGVSARDWPHVRTGRHEGWPTPTQRAGLGNVGARVQACGCEPDGLMVLSEEYRETQPDGYGYSRFCDLFREVERRLSPVMRQHHVVGDTVFVDYSGKTIAIVDPGTGVVHDAEIFVGVLGASSYTYAEASFTQTLPDWISAHVRIFRFFGGVPRLTVPDNLKSGVHFVGIRMRGPIQPNSSAPRQLSIPGG